MWALSVWNKYLDARVEASLPNEHSPGNAGRSPRKRLLAVKARKKDEMAATLI
jgi:hypothetical protein